MTGKSRDWRGAPGRTKALAGTATAGVVLGVFCLAASRPDGLARTSVVEPLLWVYLGFTLFALALGLIVVVCASEYRRLNAAGAFRPLLTPPFERPWPLENGRRWVDVAPDVYPRRLRPLRVRQGVVVVLVAVGVLATVSMAPHRTFQWFIGCFAGAAVAYTWLFVMLEARAVHRMRAMRIGTDGVNAMFDPGNGVIESVSLDTVRFDGYQILIGRRIVVLSDAWNREMFLAEPLRGVLLARLRSEAFVARGWVFVHALARGNAAMIASTCGVVVIVALMIAMELHPKAMQSAVRSFTMWFIDRVR